MSDKPTRVLETRKTRVLGDTDRKPEPIANTPSEKPQPIPAAPSSEADDSRTRLFRPRKKEETPVNTSSPSPSQSTASNPGALREDPVVGWLVIEQGPGRGLARQLGYGMNSIGRAMEERVTLDFGDNEISRHNHAVLTYDPRGRRFYVQHGGATNLTYVDDNPVLQPVELHGGERISLGSTVLRFVALCGPDFDWQDAE